MSVLRRIAREPLVHFLLIGALLFGGLTAVKSLRRPVVRLDAQDLNQLGAYWEAQMQRPPSKAELAGIIGERIDEELLAREALRLGLDKGDMIVRRRLAQKMAFATDDVAQSAEPSEATLRADFARTADRYAAAGRVSFQQVFFSGDRPHGGAAKAAGQALERAEEGGRADPTGDPFLFPLAYDDASLQDLLRDYGAAFVKTLETAPVGTWQGPVLSPYGWHIVKVTARRKAAATAFEAVRDQVRDAWLAERRGAANAAFLHSLRKRYRVVVAGVPED
ncbi:peptidylprolyl isomerase [Phenylobacterium sp.]|uniref:peptidylprolyl isomerase n=1 Tax=Phenylobacterium sp. TaxID=1871053 RepID=UPI00286B2D4F|nr:peptidylprolyl isomerase [Phenylobacterium sp.]